MPPELHSDQERQENLRTVSLKDALISTTFRPNRALDPSIGSLRLEGLQEDFAELLRVTLEDHPVHRESRKILYVTQDGKLLVEQRASLGSEEEVRTRLTSLKVYSRDPSTPIIMRQNRNVGAIAHTHGDVDVPPSVGDFKMLLTGPENPYGRAAVIVITPAMVHVIFRGSQSRSLSEKEAEDMVEKWDNMVEERIRSNIHPFMTREEQIAINLRVQNAFIRDFTKLRGFIHFSGQSSLDPSAAITLQRQYY